jgi:hypothetical protein
MAFHVKNNFNVDDPWLLSIWACGWMCILGVQSLSNLWARLDLLALLGLGKVVYEGSWRWLLRGYPYRRNQNPAHFNWKEKHMSKQRPIMASDTLKSVVEYERWLAARNTPRSKGDPSKVSGIKHRSALYDIPYFEVCKLHSTILPRLNVYYWLWDSNISFQLVWLIINWMHFRIWHYFIKPKLKS